MEKIIVTAGPEGADIDVFACVIAYAELLRLEGKKSTPVILGNFTVSVTPSILEWGAKYKEEYIPDGSEGFVLTDVSDPVYFPNFVDIGKITEVYDHRHGHEAYWREKIGKGAHIEMVGSCGTLIWEEYKKRGKERKISVLSARLLFASIVSNTLNFKSSKTMERDINAYRELKEIANLPDDWIPKYFTEQEKTLLSDLKKYIEADTKKIDAKGGKFVIGQIELWDADKFVETKKDEMGMVMRKYGELPWIVNIPNISKGFNYIYSESEEGKGVIEEKLGVVFTGDIAKTDKLIQRKQIIKILRG